MAERSYADVAEDPVACSGDECHPLTKPLSTIAYNISNDVAIIKQHYNTPRDTREEPVGDVVSRRINESGRKLHYLYRSGCHIQNQDYYASIRGVRVVATNKCGWMALAYGFSRFIGTTDIFDDKRDAKDAGIKILAKRMEEDRKSAEGVES